MFGYIKPYKPELKFKEFDTFKAVYCGLCKQLSKTYGPFASLTLSYDFTFVAMISLGLKKECNGFKKCKCVANPLKKKMCVTPCDDLTFCSSVALIMMYHKVKDDIADSKIFKKIGKIMLLPFVSSARKKAVKLYPEIDEAIVVAMSKQYKLENSNEHSIDKAADPTASALGIICEGLSDKKSQKIVLNRFGYILGRYVYYADALDDLEKDIKSGGYNPFLTEYNEKTKKEKKAVDKNELLKNAKEYANSVINMTIGELCPAYELLELNRYKTILDNIIYLGLHNEVNRINLKDVKGE